MTLTPQSAADRARILTEALPYIQRFQGKTIVIKSAATPWWTTTSSAVVARDVVLMQLVGMNPMVVHGGGPQIGDLLERLAIPTRFVDGLRLPCPIPINNTEQFIPCVLSYRHGNTKSNKQNPITIGSN